MTPRTGIHRMLTREALEEREVRELAPYAMKAGDSAGRRHAEAEHTYRTAYQRDRDRIIHCSAFRRLEYKTQVFVNSFGDYYRTRLTHTMEVAQIARTIARALGLNEDLTETVALAHDLGHGPFGHTGEDALAAAMRDHGGFEHNRQALRIVELLECKYPGFPGLNLTEEVRSSLLKHGESELCLEAQVVDASDRIAYNTHDIDDGVQSGLLDERALNDVTLWRHARAQVEGGGSGLADDTIRAHTVRGMINAAVTDLLESSLERLDAAQPGSAVEARDVGARLIAPSESMAKKQQELASFLFDNFYNEFRVRRMRSKAHYFLGRMFETFSTDLLLLPPATRALAERDGIHRAVCDTIASMTDREALLEYRRLFEPDGEIPLPA
ncbi:MAG: dGTP triphosphohydrolase [Planctomycetota bacterium]|jgi:dGTPase